jgi:hypothetical protein
MAWVNGGSGIILASMRGELRQRQLRKNFSSAVTEAMYGLVTL